MIKESSSFRDSDSTLEFDSEHYYRKISLNYLPHYLHFKNSGLSEKLIKDEFILPYLEIVDEKPNFGFASQVVKTEKIPFVSYPYEWSFSQFKAAALLTLKINLIALDYGMILKDASMFNVQFIGCKPIFIDLSSFEIYENNSLWSGYQQFCRHFLAPLLLASYKDVRLMKLLLANMDGIDLSFTKKMVPIKSYFNSGVLLHLFLNSSGLEISNKRKIELKKKSLRLILIHLTETIQNLKLKNKKSKWGNYYNDTNYLDTGLSQKSLIIESFIKKYEINTALDVGANDGKFSKILTNRFIYTVSADIDELAVEKNFLNAEKDKNESLLSLHLNIANPSPSIGWDNTERKSFFYRANFDLILALAIVHHLFITFDISFEMIAEKFSKIGKYLIIEFPTPADEKVLFISRNKPFRVLKYNLINFRNAFEKYFIELDNKTIDSNKRIIFIYATKI
jgi:ribosomal protein L11 methylase PrmA